MTKRGKPGKQRGRPNAARQARQPVRTRKTRRLLTTVVLGAGIAAFAVGWALWPTESTRPAANLTFSLDPQIRALQQEALQVVDTVGKDFPGVSDRLVLMGNLHNSMGNSHAAIECWRQCVEMDPNRADAYRGLGLVAMRRGQHQEALDFWRKALEINPEMADLRTLSARALMALGRPQEAVAALEEEVRLSPRAATSYFELGQAHRQLNQYAKAKESYLAAVKFQPDYTNAYYGLAQACQRLGQGDELNAYLEKFRKLKAQNRQVETDQRSTYNDVVLARQSVAQTYTDAGQVYHGHGDLRSAEQHWQRAARLDPKNTTCRMQLVKVYVQGQRDREALQVCEDLRRIDPEDATTYLNIGVLNARLNQFDAALSAVDRAIALDPGNPEFRRARKEIQDRRQRGKSSG